MKKNNWKEEKKDLNDKKNWKYDNTKYVKIEMAFSETMKQLLQWLKGNNEWKRKLTSEIPKFSEDFFLETHSFKLVCCSCRSTLRKRNDKFVAQEGSILFISI